MILILFVIMLLTPFSLFPSEGETGARTLVRSLPDRPVAGSTWTLTLLIDHSEPNEVDILAPHFDEALFLEQVLKTPRLINPGMTAASAPADTSAVPPEFLERWTAMEYRFVLSSPGTVSFDAFTVITPRGQTMTAPFELRVQHPPNTAEVQNYRFVWEGMPSELRTGENAVFSLRYSGAQYASSLPKAAQFLPSVPPGYILEPLPLAPGEALAGIALKLRLIPLEANPFALARRQFSHNGAIFEIPALRIPVSRAAEQQPGAQDMAGSSAPPFPLPGAAIQNHSRLYQKYQSKCDAIYTAAKRLWEEGSRADALAELRQNERDHPAGEFFAALRREAEQSLGFTNTNDERQKRPLFGPKPRGAILRETAVRRIPDRAGEEIARFREGQPVLLNGKTPHHPWIQVTGNDDNGTSGWVPEEMIIFY